MGRRQVVRHRILVPTFGGSNPSAPAILLRKLRRIGYSRYMYSVYLLRSINNPQMTYVGFTTKDVCERMEEHNRGLTKTTAPHVPWSVEVAISFKDKKKAQEFETYLKGGSGYAFAKRHFWSANSV